VASSTRLEAGRFRRPFLLTLVVVLIATLFAAAQPSNAATTVVGVVQSQSSANYAAGIPPHPFAQGYDITGREAAMKQWVTDSQYTLKVLTDADLENRAVLDTVDVIVLPYTVAMSFNASMTVKDWIYDGGGLIPILASPRFFLDSGGQWDLWVLEMNYEAWEWGPLSEAYQMRFVNDPNVPQWKTDLQPGHPITDDALTSLGVSSATFVRPNGTGVEFGYSYNNNVESILSYSNLIGSEAQYNGWSAAQAVRYGSGRIVYFDVPLIDSYYNFNLSILSAGTGIDQGDLVDAVFKSSIDWAAQPSAFVPVNPQGQTRGEVDVWGDAIYVRQYVSAVGEWPVTGDVITRVYKPDGSLWMEQVKAKVGVEPGAQHMYNWSFPNNAPLLNGQYRVEVVYTYTYPSYDKQDVEDVLVVRSQGTNIPTAPVGPQFSLDFSNFDPIVYPSVGSLGVQAPAGAPWTITIDRRNGPTVIQRTGTGNGSATWDGNSVAGPYLVTADFGSLGSEQRFVQIGNYEWPFVDDEGSYARAEIEQMWDRGLTQGCDWNLFCPDTTLSRAQLATLVARSMGDSSDWPSYKGYYSDVPAGQWYTGPIEYLVEAGVLSGGGSYGVGFAATRALVVDMMMTAIGDTSYPTYQGYFSDVAPGDWFRLKVERAKELGIANGYPDGTFRPYNSLTREEAAAFLMRGL